MSRREYRVKKSEVAFIFVNVRRNSFNYHLVIVDPVTETFERFFVFFLFIFVFLNETWQLILFDYF